MLNIFSDREYLPNGYDHVVMLYPFWGKNAEDPNATDSGRYDRYTEEGVSFFILTELPDADIAVLPTPWEHVVSNPEATAKAYQLAEAAQAYGKAVSVFFWSDSAEEVSIPNAVVFRTSMYRSKRSVNEHAMPAWSADLVAKNLAGHLPIHEKLNKPVVGFCGYAEPIEGPTIRKLPRVLQHGLRLVGISEKTPKSAAIRTVALQTLATSNLVQTNFLIREQFLAGALQSDGATNERLMQQARSEFVQNMVESDYIVCARGNGNFSYRLYETLSCGRIPVFVDTDCVLPYESIIDWKKYCVWIDENDIPAIAERVAEFHAALSPQDFVQLQLDCRKLWEQWLSPEGFFANFYRHFKIE